LTPESYRRLKVS